MVNDYILFEKLISLSLSPKLNQTEKNALEHLLIGNTELTSQFEFLHLIKQEFRKVEQNPSDEVLNNLLNAC